ncbi:hypothetical protein [Sorangium sp. So ce693]|uniref:hypothetical protein n=1 Tax=Sorangium sp. So ce693 TaxID=3133318 RepID=UPI003F63A9C7
MRSRAVHGGGQEAQGHLLELTRGFGARAHREGHTAEEHLEGWRLRKLASGEQRSLKHPLVEASSGGVVEGADRMRLLQEVDTFENM